MNKVNRELKKLDKDPLDFATLNVWFLQRDDL